MTNTIQTFFEWFGYTLGYVTGLVFGSIARGWQRGWSKSLVTRTYLAAESGQCWACGMTTQRYNRDRGLYECGKC